MPRGQSHTQVARFPGQTKNTGVFVGICAVFVCQDIAIIGGTKHQRFDAELGQISDEGFGTKSATVPNGWEPVRDIEHLHHAISRVQPRTQHRSIGCDLGFD